MSVHVCIVIDRDSDSQRESWRMEVAKSVCVHVIESDSNNHRETWRIKVTGYVCVCVCVCV